MGIVRRQHSSKIKLEAAIAMVSGKAPVAELCQKYGAHQSVLQRWKRELLDKGADIFITRKKPTEEHTPSRE
ncbi:MAG: transposase [Alphaproteobacteria bacterium]|nr:transposase [Alphaproteobacteria bacterium]